MAKWGSCTESDSGWKETLRNHFCASCVAGLLRGSCYDASLIPGITALQSFAILFLNLSIFFFFLTSCLNSSSWLMFFYPLGRKGTWVLCAFSPCLCLGKDWAGLAEVETFSKIFKFCLWAFPLGLGEAVCFSLPVPSHSELGRTRESLCTLPSIFWLAYKLIQGSADDVSKYQVFLLEETVFSGRKGKLFIWILCYRKHKNSVDTWEGFCC